jgi:hypothetical protein
MCPQCTPMTTGSCRFQTRPRSMARTEASVCHDKHHSLSLVRLLLCGGCVPAARVSLAVGQFGCGFEMIVQIHNVLAQDSTRCHIYEVRIRLLTGAHSTRHRDILRGCSRQCREPQQQPSRGRGLHLSFGIHSQSNGGKGRIPPLHKTGSQTERRYLQH